MLDALLGGGEGVVATGGLLNVENPLHAFDVCLAGLEFFDFGDHNASPWTVMDLD